MCTVDDEDISMQHFLRQDPSNSEVDYKGCETFRVMVVQIK